MNLPQPLPVIAIVGRPNTGKSAFFNRVLKERRAVVHPTPGVTRDRNYGRAEYHGRLFFLVDTGGFETETDSKILLQMREQTLIAVEEADAVIFLADVHETENPTDDEIIQILREKGRPIFLAVNKCDSPALDAAAYGMSRFGFDRIYPISALHGRGMLDLLDDLVESLPEPEEEGEADIEMFRPGIIHVAIIGRQNAGKSTLVNRLLGQERVIANSLPGTTRDAIDSYVEHDGQTFCLIDTAGIRRRGKIERGIEHLSVLSAVLAIQRCDVAVLVIDAAAGIQAQDAHIGGILQDEARPCIIALTKWDIVPDREKAYSEMIRKVRDVFNYLPHALIVTISGKTGQRCSKIWSLIRHCSEQANRKIATSELNRVLQAAVGRVSPPVFRGRVLTIKYAVQTGQRPPVFTLFVNDPTLVHFSYKRYLINQIRNTFGFEGTPIVVRFKRKSPPEGWENELKRPEKIEEREFARSQAPGRVEMEEDVWAVDPGEELDPQAFQEIEINEDDFEDDEQ